MLRRCEVNVTVGSTGVWLHHWVTPSLYITLSILQQQCSNVPPSTQKTALNPLTVLQFESLCMSVCVSLFVCQSVLISPCISLYIYQLSIYRSVSLFITLSALHSTFSSFRQFVFVDLCTLCACQSPSFTVCNILNQPVYLFLLVSLHPSVSVLIRLSREGTTMGKLSWQSRWSACAMASSSVNASA